MNAYELAKAEVGTLEWAEGSNPKVIAYYKDAGFPGIKDDDVAWCSAFVGAMLARSGVKPSGSLLARSYLNWGVPVQAKDVVPGGTYIGVIPRGADWQGHTFFIEKIVAGKVYALGGNMKDSVRRDIYKQKDLLGIRAPSAADVIKSLPPKQPAKPSQPAQAPTTDKPSQSFLVWLKSSLGAIFKTKGTKE